MYQLDTKDRHILQLLQQDAKANIKEIAYRVGLSATPVYERIKRLEKRGIISHYSAILDREKIGLDLLVFCQVSLQKHNKNHIADFEQAVEQMHEVQEAYHIAGDFDYLLKIVIHDSKQYHNFLVEKLSKLDMIANVQSNFVMFKTKESKFYNLSDYFFQPE
jgi:DNA-binding Lrp family transcriptional regulator